MKGKILITGGAGFIGSNLALTLINKGYTITVLDNLSKQVHENGKKSDLYLSIKDKVKFIEGDVRNETVFKKAMENQDIVVHLAAETGTGQSMYEISRYVDVNIQGTAVLLNILTNTRHSIQKVIVASSRAVYGEGKYLCEKHGIVYPEERREVDLKAGRFECTCPSCNGEVKLQGTDEKSTLHPSSVYGITKHTQEQMVLKVCYSIGLPAIAFRYQNVYGPGQSLSNPYTGILSIFSTQIKNNSPINIFEDGKESRDFVYIDDVVRATVLGIENNFIVNDVLNVGSEKPIDVLSVAKTLICKYGSRIKPIITGNYRIGDIRHNYADMTKASEILGYSQTKNFDEGVSHFVDWVNRQTIKSNNYSASVIEMRKKGLFK